MNVIRLQGDPFYRAIRVAIHRYDRPLRTEHTYAIHTLRCVWLVVNRYRELLLLTLSLLQQILLLVLQYKVSAYYLVLVTLLLSISIRSQSVFGRSQAHYFLAGFRSSIVARCLTLVGRFVLCDQYFRLSQQAWNCNFGSIALSTSS